MKAKVIKTFKDKVTKSILRPGQEIQITEERFLELTEGPRGVFVEKIKEDGELLTAEALEAGEPLPPVEPGEELTIKEAPAKKKTTKK